VDDLVQGLADLGDADELTELLGVEVVQALKGNVLLLKAFDDVLGHGLELAQGRHGRPRALVDHLAHVEGLLGKLGPAALEAHLKERAEKTSSRLGDVDHVRDERKAVELELRDVRLQEHVDLGRGFVHALLDRDGRVLEQLLELELFLLANGDKLELVRQRKHAEELNLRHGRLEVGVVCAHACVGHVVVAGNAANLGRREAACFPVVLRCFLWLVLRSSRGQKE